MSDHDDIRGLLAEQDEAWARGDAAGFSRAVSDDCVFTNIFGMVFTGREAFEAQHARIFATIYRGTQLTQRLDHLRFLRPDVAAADITARVSGVAHAPPGLALQDGAFETRLLQVLVRDVGGAWQVRSFHNVDVKPPPA